MIALGKSFGQTRFSRGDYMTLGHKDSALRLGIGRKRPLDIHQIEENHLFYPNSYAK